MLLIFPIYATTRYVFTSPKADSVNCPPFSRSMGSWCDYRHTENENDRNSAVLNPNYLDTYQSCYGKCIPVEASQCNECHFGNSLVCVQKGSWGPTADKCSYICNWDCCGGQDAVSACTIGYHEPSPVPPTQVPTQPPAPTRPPADTGGSNNGGNNDSFSDFFNNFGKGSPTTAPQNIAQPTPIPTREPEKPISPGMYKTLGPNGEEIKPVQQNGVSEFLENTGTKIAFEWKLNTKRVSFFLTNTLEFLIKPFKNPAH